MKDKSVTSAIAQAKCRQVITPDNLVGQQRRDYEAWVQAFADGTLDRKRSLMQASSWIMENTDVNCTERHVKMVLQRDSEKVKIDGCKTGNKRRTDPTKANTARSPKRTKKKATTD